MLGRFSRLARLEVRSRERRPRVESLERRALLTAFTVTSAADSGTGTLRAAITQADADNTVGGDTISFAIGTGPQTITLQSALPAITRTVAIDATTQPQAAGQSSTAPRIILDGTSAGAGADGLSFTGGTGSVVRGVAIVNFAGTTTGGGRGILAADSGGDTFTGNDLGIEPDGTTVAADAVGIELQSPNNTVGAIRSSSTTAATGNLISGNTSDGVLIDTAAATGNQVIGNQIGTNAAGTAQAGNQDGVTIEAAGNNTIGGTAAGAGNLISGNTGTGGNTGIGVYFTGTSSGNVVAGNRIGTDITGTLALSNAYGIYLGTVDAATTTGEVISATTIGGTAAGAGNVITGNGVGIFGTVTGSLIAGNLIGTDALGTTGIGNGYGIFLTANGTTIGGTAAGARNVISASGKNVAGGVGLTLSGDTDTVANNLIGTDITGTAALPNAVGISLHTTNSTIGEAAAGAGNLIAGNTGDGIDLDSDTGNMVLGNTIGTTSGTALGNGGDGINVILAAASGTTSGVAVDLNDTIGDPTTAGNTIAGNSGAGVALTNSAGDTLTGLSIRGNDITDNGLLGISLGSNPSVPTLGTLTLTSVAAGSLVGTISGVVGGTPGQVVLVDFYGNTAADPSGYGEGQAYLGTTAVTIGPGGLATFAAQIGQPIVSGTLVTATATLPGVPTSTAAVAGTTSEFSAAFPNTLPSADVGVTQTVSAPTTSAGGIITFTATVTNTGTTTAGGVVFTDEFGTGLSNVTATSTVGAPTLTGDNVVTVPLGDLTAGESVTITVSANASTNGTYTNTAGVLGTTPDPNDSNNTASEPYTIGTATATTADLAIAVTPSAATVTAGGNLTYTVTVTNNGPNDATGVIVNDFLPTGATLTSASASQGTANSSLAGNLLVSTLGDLANGASATLTLVVSPPTAGSITEVASVMGGQLDPTPTNNRVSTSSTVSAVATSSLTLTQALNPTAGTPGQIQLFILTVQNTGTATASGVVLVDALPAGSTYVYAGATTGAPTTFSNNVITSDLGTLAAGASATVILVVVPNGTTSSLSNFAGVVAAGDATPTPVFSTAALSVAGGATAAAAGPSVTSVVGSRSNAQLVVGFSEPITPASATTKANYRLYDLGLTARAVTANDRPIAFTTAVAIANSGIDSVTLTPSRSINATHYYALVVVGNTARGITDTTGRKLVGVTGGTAGTNFSTTFLAGQLTQA